MTGPVEHPAQQRHARDGLQALEGVGRHLELLVLDPLLADALLQVQNQAQL